jgi:hypothetical protein
MSLAFPVMQRKTAERFVPFMRELGVSEVARSPRGFFNQWGRFASGVWDRTDPKFGQLWRVRRDNFCRRHSEQFRKNPTLRRFLALVAWAYTPLSSAKTQQVLRALEARDLSAARRALGGSISRSASRSVSRSVSRSASRSASRSFSCSISRSVSRSVSRSR